MPVPSLGRERFGVGSLERPARRSHRCSLLGARPCSCPTGCTTAAHVSRSLGQVGAGEGGFGPGSEGGSAATGTKRVNVSVRRLGEVPEAGKRSGTRAGSQPGGCFPPRWPGEDRSCLSGELRPHQLGGLRGLRGSPSCCRPLRPSKGPCSAAGPLALASWPFLLHTRGLCPPKGGLGGAAPPRQPHEGCRGPWLAGLPGLRAQLPAGAAGAFEGELMSPGAPKAQGAKRARPPARGSARDKNSGACGCGGDNRR